MNNLKLERNYLIKIAEVELRSTVFDITETYLVSEDPLERVLIKKHNKNNGHIYFFYLERKYLNGVHCSEDEVEINNSDYNFLLSGKDNSIPELHITKTIFLHSNQVFEMDVYPFSEEYATLTIELENGNDEIHLPSFIEIVKEITCDENYKSKLLAQNQNLPL